MDFRHLLQVQFVTSDHMFTADQTYKSVSQGTLLRFDNMLAKLTELRKPIYSLDYWFITKYMKGYESTIG